MRTIRPAAIGAALPLFLFCLSLTGCGGNEAKAPAPTGGVVLPPAGTALVFRVSRPNGDLVYGAVALSANIM